MKKYLYKYESLSDLSDAAVECVIKCANEAIESRGVFRLALAGGSTPRGLYERLGSTDYLDQTDWSAWVIYFGDERFTPLSDEQSNYFLAKTTFLDTKPFQGANIHAVPVYLNNIQDVARTYERDIKKSFGDDAIELIFDLILLGLGSDGHTASLFPGSDSLAEMEHLVVSTSPGVLPPQVDRVTFTFPLINSARHIIFLVAGSDKRDVFRRAYAHQDIPAGQVKLLDGRIDWFVVKDAA